MKKISSLEDHLGYWMRFVSNHVSAEFKQKLKQSGVSVAEWVVLRQLYDQKALTPSILAEMTRMTRGAMTKLLDRLAHKNLVEREVLPKDRRFQTVSLSKVGKNLLPCLAAHADANDRQFFGHLSNDQTQQLLRILKEIVTIHAWKEPPID